MNNGAGGLIKNLIAGMYFLIGAGAAGSIIYLVVESRNTVNDVLWVYLPPLMLLLGICAAQGYGLMQSRRWAYTLHTGLMIIWIPFIAIIALPILPEVWRQRDLAWFSLVVVAVGLPIAIQWFLRKNRDRLLHPPGPTTWRVRAVVTAVVGMTGVIIVPVLVMVATFEIFDLTSGGRERIAAIENLGYRATLYYDPGFGAFGEGCTRLISVDKRSPLKGEKTMWRRDYRHDYRLSFLDSNVVGMYDGADTIIIDLSSVPLEIEDTERHPPWRTELDYEGCTDEVVAENDEFAVTWRRYPSLAGHYRGATRLLLEDKSSWFGRDRVLIEAFEEDSVEAAIVGKDTLKVVVHFLDPSHYQYRRHGGQDTRVFDLRDPPDYPVDY